MDAKKYNPDVDKAGFAEAFIGRAEQVTNGGPGSGNFGHEGRPGQIGGSGEGGGTGGKQFIEPSKGKPGSGWGVVIADSNEPGGGGKGAPKGSSEYESHLIELGGSPADLPNAPMSDRESKGMIERSKARSFATKYSEVGVNPEELGEYERKVEMSLSRAKEEGLMAHPDHRAAERHALEAADYVNSHGGKGIGGTVYSSQQATPDSKHIPMVAYGAGTTPTQAGRILKLLREGGFKTVKAPEGGGFLVTHEHASPEFWTGKQNDADTMQPGTVFVPQGNKEEMVTNPPYQTPELGDAPKEMQKEADRIYKDLRKNQYSAETGEARGAAAGTMWTILKKSWKKDKEGKWVKKE